MTEVAPISHILMSYEKHHSPSNMAIPEDETQDVKVRVGGGAGVACERERVKERSEAKSMGATETWLAEAPKCASSRRDADATVVSVGSEGARGGSMNGAVRVWGKGRKNFQLTYLWRP